MEKKIDDPVQVANSFNNFFSTIAERTLQNNSTRTHPMPPDPPIITHNTFHFRTVAQTEVLSAINTLKPKNSSGTDEITAKMIKNCKTEIALPLTDLINKSLRQGIFPDKLKIAKIYPKYKSGQTTETNSYRPISLISTFSKLIEKIVLNQLLQYLLQHNLLNSQQHGFCKGRSTTTAIIQLVEHIIDQLEEGCISTCLFLDFSKAFDCLNHEQLLHKLGRLGIGGKAAQWFRSYLSNRKQLVEIAYIKNNIKYKAYSNTANIQRGVPQGSVLGPVLFLLFANDLPGWIGEDGHTVMYADDTVGTFTDRTTDRLKDKTDNQFNRIKQYCSANDLVLNENKTVQMTFTTKRSITDTSLAGLQTQTNTKYLGITIDSKLCWKPHIDELCKKLCSSLYVIRRIKHVCNPEVARIAYFALFESHLRYGIAVWGGASKNNLERTLVKQKGAIRCLANLNYRDSCRESFKNLKILTAVSLYIREVILHSITTTQPRNMDLHQYNTRHATDFSLPQHHLSLYKQKPSYKGALYYNKLPEHLKREHPKNFKKRLTSWLLERPLYSEEEFLNDQL